MISDFYKLFIYIKIHKHNSLCVSELLLFCFFNATGFAHVFQNASNYFKTWSIALFAFMKEPTKVPFTVTTSALLFEDSPLPQG
jgi:hypothetical protein